MKVLIPDKFYRIQDIIFKFFKYYEDTQIYHIKYFIIKNSFRNTNAYYGYETINNCDLEEVDITEVVKYLPVGHPDRILFRKQRINKLLYGIDRK